MSLYGTEWRERGYGLLRLVVIYLGALDEVNWSHALLRLLLQQELQGGAGSLTASWVRHKMLNCGTFYYSFRAEQL